MDNGGMAAWRHRSQKIQYSTTVPQYIMSGAADKRCREGNQYSTTCFREYLVHGLFEHASPAVTSRIRRQLLRLVGVCVVHGVCSLVAVMKNGAS